MKYELPDLPYDYSALEPVISGEIMELHHSKHHKAYVTNLNAALEKYKEAEAKNDLKTCLSLESAIAFNGGGHINHSIFWAVLAPTKEGGGSPPSGELAAAITQQYGSFDAFKESFTQMTVAVQGSGWGWLGLCPKTSRLVMHPCPNQVPLSNLGLIPLMGIDVWEHAYYLQYKNVRPDYVKAIWGVINWKAVEKRYLDGVK
jgi:superoxide dismutase, Fe-Mn family